MASPSRPVLTRLETKAVEEDARSKSTRSLWRQLFEEFCEFLRSKGLEIDYPQLDHQLSDFLRAKYFEGKPRSYAVSMIRAVKFEVPSELGRDSLGRARNAVACWDEASGPWLEMDPEKVRAMGLQALGTAALCDFLGRECGLALLLQLRGTAKGMPEAVDSALYRAFKDSVPGLRPEDMRGCKLFVQDLRAFLAKRLAGTAGEDPAEEPTSVHPALRLVVANSPAYLRMEVCGAAPFQMEGTFGLLGNDLYQMICDTVGLLFHKPWFGGGFSRREYGDIALAPENNMDKSQTTGAPTAEVVELGERLRRFLDPMQLSDAMQLLNPDTLSTVTQLLPDGKYDAALVQETFTPYDTSAAYALEETNWLKKIRGNPRVCYLAGAEHGPQQCDHLLKTQEHLDPARVQFYTVQLQDCLAAGSRKRPTALVLDFFTRGAIHAVQLDEADEVRGPGGRRLQKRRREACEKGYMKRAEEGKNDTKAWILLDGHHKVEAAARLGCSMNFLVLCPCAEPYEPLAAGDEFAPAVSRAAAFPAVWPDGASPTANWEAGRLCSHSPMRLSSSRQPPEEWLLSQGCPCFNKDEWFPPWAFAVFKTCASATMPTKSKVIEACKQVFGEDHPLFTTYAQTDMGHLPEDMRMALFTEAVLQTL